MSSESSAGDYGNVLVTPGELVSVLGLTESRISALKRRGVIQAARPRKNEFHLGPAVRGYMQYKCGCASESEADYHRERALKERANRQLREILMEQTRDQLHDAQAV